jgi:hypothetical protein
MKKNKEIKKKGRYKKSKKLLEEHFFLLSEMSQYPMIHLIILVLIYQLEKV